MSHSQQQQQQQQQQQTPLAVVTIHDACPFFVYKNIQVC
jgi:hypothetical protein